MVLKINGTDIFRLTAAEGIKMTKRNVTANQVTTLDGTTYIGRVTTKMTIDITCKPMSATDAAALAELLNPEYVEVEYTDPLLGDRFGVFWVDTLPLSLRAVNVNGVEWFNGCQFSLTER